MYTHISLNLTSTNLCLWFSNSLNNTCYAWGKYRTSGYFGYYTIFLKSDKHFLTMVSSCKKCITGQNVWKLQISLFFASYIACILKDYHLKSLGLVIINLGCHPIRGVVLLCWQPVLSHLDPRIMHDAVSQDPHIN